MEKRKCILCGSPIRDDFKFIEDDLKRCPACNSELVQDIDYVEEVKEDFHETSIGFCK